MGRSVKKGPFVQPVLLKRVKAMNEAGEKRVLKTWSRSSTIFPDFVGHTFPYTLPRTWLATSWASSPPPAPLRATRAARPPVDKEG